MTSLEGRFILFIGGNNMYNSFKLIKKIYYERTSGSKNELKAAETIAKMAQEYGLEAKIEPFEVDAYEIKNAQLHFKNPSIKIPFVGVGMSGSTSKEGVLKDLVYVSSYEDAIVKDIKDKIVLFPNKMVDNKTYKVFAKKKPAALILCTGDVYLDSRQVDLDPYKFRQRHYNLAKIPSVCIRMKDAEKLLENLPEKAFINLQQKEFKVNSHNVVCEIKGSKYKDEIITFTAHYDTVPYSKGAYDNASGSAGIMELLAFFKKHKPLRTLKFIWCGSEEEGLLGCKAYIEKHKKELNKTIFNINIDMIGATLGKDIAVATAEDKLVSYLQYLSRQVGFALEVKQGVYSSDSTPFADNGVPAISFARISNRGGASIHSRKDVIERLSEQNYYKTCEFIKLFASNLVNAVAFPVERVIPDKMKEELDYYNFRKERQ